MKIAVILSGCGNLDGSEIQETMSLLLAIDRRGWQYQCFAPEGPYEVVKYVNSLDDDEGEEGTVVDIEQRDLLEESGRLVRGEVKPLSEYNVNDFDALAMPGGLGAARNLSTFAFDGEKMVVIDQLIDIILANYRASKTICAMCIAPIILAKVLGRNGIHITLGTTDNPAAQIATSFGAIVEPCEATGACVDKEHKIYTTPAYMVGTHISEIFDGAQSMISAIE